MLALRSARENTFSTCSFNRQLVIWVKQGKVTLYNQGDTTHLSKNILQDSAPSRYPFTSGMKTSPRSIAENHLSPNQSWLFQVSMPRFTEELLCRLFCQLQDTVAAV